MTAQPQHAMGPFSFRAAEHHVEVPEMRRRLRRSTGLFLTADAKALRQLLPAGISPVLSRPGRAWVMVVAADGEIALGALPPVRFGEVEISAWVSHGDRMLPPGVALPGVLQKTTEPAFGVGTFDLLRPVTNRFVRDIYAMIGYRPVVAGLRWEERRELDRVTCIIDGEPALDIAMRTEGRPRPSADVFLEYGLRDGHLVRWVYDYGTTETRMVVRPAAGGSPAAGRDPWRRNCGRCGWRRTAPCCRWIATPLSRCRHRRSWPRTLPPQACRPEARRWRNPSSGSVTVGRKPSTRG